MDGIANKVEFHTYMAGSGGCNGRSCGAKASLIIFADDGGLVVTNSKFIEELLQVQCFGSCSTQGDVFGLSSGFRNSRLKFTAVTDDSPTEKETLTHHRATIMGQRS